jgi:hypothetical protein
LIAKFDGPKKPLHSPVLNPNQEKRMYLGIARNLEFGQMFFGARQTIEVLSMPLARAARAADDNPIRRIIHDFAGSSTFFGRLKI